MAGSVGDCDFLSGAGSLLYGNLFYHSPYYAHTSLPALDRRELSLDFGWMLRGRKSSGMANWIDGRPGAGWAGSRSVCSASVTPSRSSLFPALEKRNCSIF